MGGFINLIDNPVRADQNFSKEAQRKYFDCAWNKRPFLTRDTWDMANASALIALLAVHGKQRPVRFLYCHQRAYYIVNAATFVDPTMEITGYDHWEECDQDAWVVSVRLAEAGFTGHYHTLCGPEETTFDRLSGGHFINEPYQSVFQDLDFLKINPSTLISQITPFFDKSSSLSAKAAGRCWNLGMPSLGRLASRSSAVCRKSPCLPQSLKIVRLCFSK